MVQTRYLLVYTNNVSSVMGETLLQGWYSLLSEEWMLQETCCTSINSRLELLSACIMCLGLFWYTQMVCWCLLRVVIPFPVP